MYTAIHYDKEVNGVILFDDVEGKVELDYKPYYWKPSDRGDHYTIFGQPCEKTHRYSKDYYEIDVSPTSRILLDRYDESVAKNVTAYTDIETSSEGGFPNIEEGDKEVLSITTLIGNTLYVLVVETEQDIKLTPKNIKLVRKDGTEIPFDFDLKFYECENDSELLIKFSKLLNKKNVTIITDWNGDRFDLPYIINRMKRLGLDYYALSPVGLIKQRENGFYSLVCRNHLDYLEIYKKYSINDRSSYALNSIAELELGIGKIKHSGLDNLYKNDINTFLEYNIRDVILIYLLEKKLNYLQIAIYLAHKTHIPYEQVFQQSRIVEGGIFVYLKKNKLVAINKPEKGEGERIEGAYVKDPVPGLYKNIIDLDFTSLYPNIIRTLNISTETKIGKVLDWVEYLGDFYKMNQGKEFEDQEVTVVVGTNTSKTVLSKFKAWLDKRNYSIACNGIIYSLDKMGFIGNIITEWFDERVLYKNLRKKAEKEGNEEKKKEYDIKQYVMKILMNSFYGALAMSSFRFYDRDLAESVTITGQYLTKLSERNVNGYFR